MELNEIYHYGGRTDKPFGKDHDDDALDRFEEIMGEITDMVDEAMQIVRGSGDQSAYARADSYWKGHITQAVEKRDWFSMAATLEELRDEGNRR